MLERPVIGQLPLVLSGVPYTDAQRRRKKPGHEAPVQSCTDTGPDQGVGLVSSSFCTKRTPGTPRATSAAVFFSFSESTNPDSCTTPSAVATLICRAFVTGFSMSALLTRAVTTESSNASPTERSSVFSSRLSCTDFTP